MACLVVMCNVSNSQPLELSIYNQGWILHKTVEYGAYFVSFSWVYLVVAVYVVGKNS